jgi:FKBP-type peptidyl-prolyl cis-trans isomerase SlyD
MKIGENSVVSIDYTLKGDDGTVIDTSEGREPLSFVFGIGTIIPGLEKELDGKTAGETFAVTIAPEDGYGEYDDSRMVEVPKEHIEGADGMSEGVQVQAQREDGGIEILTVASIGEKTVILDGNHPLAGKNLHFNVDVKKVREATKEEIEHGHVH